MDRMRPSEGCDVGSIPASGTSFPEDARKRSVFFSALCWPLGSKAVCPMFPVEILLHAKSRTLTVAFDDGSKFDLPFEFLRVLSPSADVAGHGPGEEKLQVGKRNVTIVSAEPVGNYALRIAFSDGHDTGLYSWEYLAEIGMNREELWREYLGKLAAAGASREPDDPANAPFLEQEQPSCPSHQHHG